ncbi:MAG: hypothetical protein P8Y63_00170 [Deltaproteobacteria bacterium]
MFGKEEETGKRILAVDSHGTEIELREFIQLFDEQGFEVEGRTLLRTPGGRKVEPVRGKEGQFVVEGSGEALRQLKVTMPASE